MTKILIIEARFYDEFSDPLLAGAQLALKDSSVSFDVLTVPGALEIPAALQFAAESKAGYDAYVVLGCIIRGETTHYDVCCNESARGVYDVVAKHGLALGNGILTVENEDQAMDRADPARQDKGGGAAKAALRMLEIKRQYLKV